MKGKLCYTINKDNWYFCDFETTTTKTQYYQDTNDTCVVLSSSRNYITNQFINHFDIDSYLEWVFSLDNGTFFFHNLSFDGNFILPALVRLGFKPEFNHGKKSTYRRTFDVFQEGSKFYYIDVKIRAKNKDKHYVFRDTLKWLPTSIKNLGKSLNINKFKENQNTKEFYDVEPYNLPQEFIDYCNRDTEILREAVIKFDEVVNSIETVKKYNEKNFDNPFQIWSHLTLGSISLAIYKTLYLQDYKANNPNFEFLIEKKDYERADKYFVGGYTNFNEQYQGEPKSLDNQFGIVLDIVSSYPFQMTKQLPYGKFLTEKPQSPHETFVFGKVKNIRIKSEKYYQPIWRRGNLKINTRFIRDYDGEVEFYFIKEEFEYMRKWYDFEVIEYHEEYCLTSNFLSDFINDLFYYKNKFSKEKNEVFKLVIKLMINSVYGKLCESASFDSIIHTDKDFKENETIVLKNKSINKDGLWYKKPITGKVLRVSTNNKIGDFNCYVVEPEDTKTLFTNRIAAATITAKARCKLYDMFEKIDVKDWLYTDTDSVFLKFKNKISYNINSMISDELGGWEVEVKNGLDKFNVWGVNASKQYVAFWNDKPFKSAFAGCELDYLQAKIKGLDWSRNSSIVEDCILISKKLQSGIVLEWKPKKFARGTN